MSERYDLFICHANEDKETVVRPLVQILKRQGLRIWYDEASIQIGDSLKKSIEAGISKSNYAAVILSPSFFVKNWPKAELDALVDNELETGVPKILLVWHQVTAKEVYSFSPALADRIAITTDGGIEQIASKLEQVITSSVKPRKPTCLLLTPLSTTYERVKEAVDAALHKAGVDVIHADASNVNASTIRSTWEALVNTDFVMADVSESNPNVFYEIGLAHALGKPTIFLVSTDAKLKVPFDIQSYRSVIYDPGELSELIPELRRVARLYADTRE